MNNDPKRRLSRPELPGISAIFNPRKLRRNSTAVSSLLGGVGASQTPSVVVTDDNLSELEFEAMLANGPQCNPSGSSGLPASSVPLLANVQHQSGIVTLDSQLIHTGSQNPLNCGQQANNNNNANLKPIAKTIDTIRRAIFSKTARKLCCGVFLSILVGCCWTLMIHAIKRAYLNRHIFYEEHPTGTGADQHNNSHLSQQYNNYPPLAFDPSKLYGAFNNDEQIYENNNNANIKNQSSNSNWPMSKAMSRVVYDAPFFTAWTLTISTILYYPFHQLTVRFCSCMGRKGTKNMSRAISDAVQGFRERGMTLFQFIGRCAVLCMLWLLTNWLTVASLRVLNATEVLALFATTTSFSYLLSWVVLHQQFVGLRIFAVILSNMGIALFAYMDGQTHKSPTVGGVILGATAAGSSAVFKVSLKKSFGFGATISQQVALIFSVVGITAIIILWPIFVTLYFTGIEVILWSYVPWELIIIAIFASILVGMLDNFGVTCTFEFFITVGLLMAIPFSAALDWYLYKKTFDGMCLAGIITVGIGFVVVLLPENWTEILTRLIRYLAQLKHHSRWGRSRWGQNQAQEPIDTRTGHIRSHLRSPSGRVR